VARVVLDTNVYISAILFGGPPAALLAMARAGAIELMVSPAILDEVAGVLCSKFGFTAAHATEVLREIRSLAHVVRPGVRLAVVREDEPDNRILECAVAAGAAYVGSGDRRHLLALGTYAGIPILPPARLLQALRGIPPGPRT
jgi:uncharacterized protein